MHVRNSHRKTFHVRCHKSIDFSAKLLHVLEARHAQADTPSCEDIYEVREPSELQSQVAGASLRVVRFTLQNRHENARARCMRVYAAWPRV